MKTELKAKFIQQILSKKKDSEGFTLIELLVVIIIIGILAAIALPSFLSQANKAKQSEAKQYLASINKGQQAYYVENTTFGSNIAALGIGIKEVTSNYTYTIGVTTADGATAAGTPAPGLKGYAGAVALVGPAGSDRTTQSILCQTTGPSAPAALTVGGTSCTGGMEAVSK